MNANKTSANSRTSDIKNDMAKNETPSILYHYTNSLKLPFILEDGMIKLSAFLLDKGERPSLWLSTNPEWEYSASCYRKESEELTNGMKLSVFKDLPNIIPVRIGVSDSSKYIGWKKFRKKSGIGKHTAKSLESISDNVGSNTKEWRASFEPIPQSEWLSLEKYENGCWKAINL